MTLERKTLGRRGEEIAASFLQEKGYKIINRNFRTRYGELDIICQPPQKFFSAKRKKDIIFVEVRSKSGSKFGSPEESINHRKKEKLRLMARQYLADNRLLKADYAIDGVFIEFSGDKYEIRHLENMIEE